MIKKILFLCIFVLGYFSVVAYAAEPKSLGKYKNWEAFTYDDGKGKICFAQTIPTERSPKNFKRDDSRLFVTFRKQEKIKNEISVTSGHVYKKSTVVAKSGKNEFAFFSQGKFAWVSDEEEEFKIANDTFKNAREKIDDYFGRFDTRYRTPRTTDFISQPFGTKEYDLFHVETISDGAFSNDQFKISIANVRASTDPGNPYGTFELQVRAFGDTDINTEIFFIIVFYSKLNFLPICRFL